MSVDKDIEVTFDTEQVMEKMKEVLREKGLSCMERSVAMAKRDSPYDTGHNRRTITGTFFLHGQNIEDRFGREEENLPENDHEYVENGFYVETASGYGGYLETGTKHMTARPYIYPAIMKNVEQLHREMENAL